MTTFYLNVEMGGMSPTRPKTIPSETRKLVVDLISERGRKFCHAKDDTYMYRLTEEEARQLLKTQHICLETEYIVTFSSREDGYPKLASVELVSF